MSRINVENIRHPDAASDSLQLSNTGNITAPGNLSVTGTSTLTDDLNVDSGTLFVDASADRVGINTTATSAQLEINSTASKINTATIKTAAGSGGFAGLAFMAGQTTAGREKAAIYFQETNGGAHFTGDIVFALNNDSGSAVQVGTADERVRIRSGGGLTFNGDTAAANALDDYEEGTWTPTISFNGNSVGVTYSVQDGHYTKIGNVVTLSFRVGISAKGSSTGNLRIEGQPFRPGTPAKRVSGILGEAMGSASRPCYVRTESGSSFMGVFQIGGGSVTDSNFTTFDNYGVVTFQI